MSEPFLIGLVGARGHTGRELMRLIAGHPELMLAYAVSREWAGRPVSDVAPEIADGSVFEALSPEEAARRRADAVVLALPDGAGASFVEAIDAVEPQRIVVDLSADRRFDDDWAYGLPELHRAMRAGRGSSGRGPQGAPLAGARRIANPGCYATAMQLALAPLVPLLGGPPSAFGVSGYSGAGTTPGPRNDPARLADNLMPYALVGHKHEREARRHLGVDVQFTPHVHPAFRGLTVTVHAPLAAPLEARALVRLYEEAYGGEPLIALSAAPPELRSAAARSGACLGGFALSEDGGGARLVAAIDNLLKGAAVQAVQNLNLALGLDEMTGLAAMEAAS